VTQTYWPCPVCKGEVEAGLRNAATADELVFDLVDTEPADYSVGILGDIHYFALNLKESCEHARLFMQEHVERLEEEVGTQYVWEPDEPWVSGEPC
jgi:hypothetical protein